MHLVSIDYFRMDYAMVELFISHDAAGLRTDEVFDFLLISIEKIIDRTRNG